MYPLKQQRSSKPAILQLFMVYSLVLPPEDEILYYILLRTTTLDKTETSMQLHTDQWSQYRTYYKDITKKTRQCAQNCTYITLNV